MHGHSFHGEIVVRGPVDPTLGWLIDYADLKRALDPIVARLDHFLLNDIAGLENPTSEMIAIWFWRQLKPAVPILHSVVIEETCTTRCVFRG